MIKSDIEEIKQAIENEFFEKLCYVENINSKKNTFSYNNKDYTFKSISIKTKFDNKEFIKIIYSLCDKDSELIQKYEVLDKKLKEGLLRSAQFPINNHIVSQNLLNNWLVNDNGYYISQNNHNGELVEKKAQGTKNFLSEDNIFNRFMHNKILTIETGLFKYFDDNFKKINEIICNLQNTSNKVIQIDIDKSKFYYSSIVNIYKFFGLYIKYNRYNDAEKNLEINKLFETLMDFRVLPNTQEEIMSFVNKDQTFLNKFFNDIFDMSFVKLPTNNGLNFSIGNEWCLHSFFAKTKPAIYYILLPLSPEVAIVIYKDKNEFEKLIKDKKNIEYMILQNINQNMRNLTQGNTFTLNNGHKNFAKQKDDISRKGVLNHLVNYTSYEIINKSIKDLVIEKFPMERISFLQRIYAQLFTIPKYNLESIIFDPYTEMASEIIISIDNRLYYLFFDNHGIVIPKI